MTSLNKVKNLNLKMIFETSLIKYVAHCLRLENSKTG
ncbi:MAG: hypothetical protein ACI9U0_000429 [Flavobacteriales bacterium]